MNPPFVPAACRLALLVALTLAACGHASGGEARRQRPPPHVVTALVAPRTVRVEVRAPVDLRPVVQVDVGAKVLGYLSLVSVDRGDRVRRGQLLAVVRPSDLPDQLAAARGALEQNRASLDLARSNLARVEALAPRGVVSQQEVQSARAAVASAEAQRAALLAQAAGTATRLQETRLTAPIDGVVLQRRVDPGALVGPSTGPVLTLVSVDSLRVFVPVTERDAASVRVGLEATLTVDALPGRAFTGTVARLAPGFDPLTRTLDAEVHLPNPDGALRPGMYGRAAIVTAVRERALVVPAAAVQRSGGRDYVYVVRGDRAERRAVTLGVDEGDALEVTSGLGPGDELVTAGIDNLSDGVTVRTARGADPFRGPAARDAGGATP